MPKPVLEDRPIWPIASEETASAEVTMPEMVASPPQPTQEATRQAPISTSGFEGFGSFSG